MKDFFVEGVKATCLFGRFDLYHRFHSGINVIYGTNGSGKTTLLHIIANALSGDYWRFFYLPFKNIEIYLSNAQTMVIERLESMTHIKINVRLQFTSSNSNFTTSLIFSQTLRKDLENEDKFSQRTTVPYDESFNEINAIYRPTDQFIEKVNQESRNHPKLNNANIIYIPAFRSNIDFLYCYERELIESNRSFYLSKSIRKVYDEFVPEINIFSIQEIQKRISEDIMQSMTSAIFEISEYFQANDIELKSENLIYLQNKNIISLLNNINELTIKEKNFPLFGNDDKTRRNFKQNKISFTKKSITAVANAKKFLESVNNFLEEKKIRILKMPINGNILGIEFIQDKSISQNDIFPLEYDISVLSSGERQLVSIIYSLIYKNPQVVVPTIYLFDEPEISLNIDWKRNLLRKLFIGNEQVLVCTHSSSIATDWIQDGDEIELSPTNFKMEFVSDKYLLKKNNSNDDLPIF